MIDKKIKSWYLYKIFRFLSLAGVVLLVIIETILSDYLSLLFQPVRKLLALLLTEIESRLLYSYDG